MSERSKHRWHAARVATVATAIVVVCYALCAIGLRQFVVQRLTAEADARLVPVLTQAAHDHAASSAPSSTSTLPLSDAGGGSSPRVELGNDDLDDAPIFLWRVGAGGAVRALTVGAPSLPVRHWSDAPVTVSVAGAPFRLDTLRTGRGWLVAGQSVSDVARVRSALVLPEVLFGLLLAAATFVGALIVGLRASAPLDVVRRRQAEFTADASHELRTPLSVVEAEVDLALRRPRRPEEYEAVLRRIAGESRRLRRIVDDLLWLARADSGTEQGSGRARADVEAVVAETVERFRPVAQRLGVSLTFDSESDARDGEASAPVQVHADLLDRLAGVLVDNACKYAGPGGTAAVSVRSAGSRVALRVEDSGPGIPPEQRTAVFDRFHRVSDAGEGAGLGLAIADSVVRMTGASWTVEDSDLGGARMEVSWKRAPGEDVIPEPGARAPVVPTAPEQGGTPGGPGAGRTDASTPGTPDGLPGPVPGAPHAPPRAAAGVMPSSRTVPRVVAGREGRTRRRKGTDS